MSSSPASWSRDTLTSNCFSKIAEKLLQQLVTEPTDRVPVTRALYSLPHPASYRASRPSPFNSVVSGVGVQEVFYRDIASTDWLQSLLTWYQVHLLPLGLWLHRTNLQGPACSQIYRYISWTDPGFLSGWLVTEKSHVAGPTDLPRLSADL